MEKEDGEKDNSSGSLSLGSLFVPLYKTVLYGSSHQTPKHIKLQMFIGNK